MLSQFDRAQAFSHHGVLIATQAMQGNDERVLLILGDFGRNEQGVGHLLVGVRKRICSLLDAGIDCAALTTAATGLWCADGRCSLWHRLLRKVNWLIASWKLTVSPAARIPLTTFLDVIVPPFLAGLHEKLARSIANDQYSANR